MRLGKNEMLVGLGQALDVHRSLAALKNGQVFDDGKINFAREQPSQLNFDLSKRTDFQKDPSAALSVPSKDIGTAPASTANAGQEAEAEMALDIFTTAGLGSGLSTMGTMAAGKLREETAEIERLSFQRKMDATPKIIPSQEPVKYSASPYNFKLR